MSSTPLVVNSIRCSCSDLARVTGVSLPTNERQSSSSILYVGENHATRLPARSALITRISASTFLPHRRPAATTLNRAASARILCCPAWGRGRFRAVSGSTANKRALANSEASIGAYHDRPFGCQARERLTDLRSCRGLVTKGVGDHPRDPRPLWRGQDSDTHIHRRTVPLELPGQLGCEAQRFPNLADGGGNIARVDLLPTLPRLGKHLREECLC